MLGTFNNVTAGLADAILLGQRDFIYHSLGVDTTEDESSVAYKIGQYAALPLGVRRAAVGMAEDVLAGGQSFLSFRALKSYLGPAGVGMHWHHLVEQFQAEKFGVEMINNTRNVVAIPADVHARISGFYSSKQLFTGGLTVREWLRSQSFNEQYQFGLDVLERYWVQ